MITSALIAQIQELLAAPNLQIFVQESWGSHCPSHREELRTFAQDFTHGHSSRAHTNGMGVFTANATPVGVDIEVSNRVTAPVVARIASAEELAASPAAADLWSAKEAAFKALKTYSQPPVISSITIGAWEKIDSQIKTFSLLNSQEFNAPLSGKGVVISLPPFTFSFFVFPS